MGVDVRKVPPGWEHPSERDHEMRSVEYKRRNPLAYKPPGWPYSTWRPLLDESYQHAYWSWIRDRVVWWLCAMVAHPLALIGVVDAAAGTYRGWRYKVSRPLRETFSDWHGERPNPRRHRPAWRDRDRTHFQLYETVSEGAPLTPPMPNTDMLVHWCASQSDEVWVGTSNMTREDWERFFARGGYAPSGIYSADRGYRSGIEAMSEPDTPTPAQPEPEHVG